MRPETRLDWIAFALPIVGAFSWGYFVTDVDILDLVLERIWDPLPAAIVVLGLVFNPVSMLATEVALRRIDGRLEEAAVLSAPPHVVLRRITLPLAAPSVLAAALVIFVLPVSGFGVPGLLPVRVYTTEVFTAFAALYDFSRAVLLAELRAAMRSELARLQRTLTVTTVYVTHDREDAAVLADRVIEMRAGRIVAVTDARRTEERA